MKYHIIYEDNGQLTANLRAYNRQPIEPEIYNYHSGSFEDLIFDNFGDALFDTYRVIKGHEYIKANKPGYGHFIYTLTDLEIVGDYDIIIHYVDVEDREDQYFGVKL